MKILQKSASFDRPSLHDLPLSCPIKLLLAAHQLFFQCRSFYFSAIYRYAETPGAQSACGAQDHQTETRPRLRDHVLATPSSCPLNLPKVPSLWNHSSGRAFLLTSYGRASLCHSIVPFLRGRLYLPSHYLASYLSSQLGRTFPLLPAVTVFAVGCNFLSNVTKIAPSLSLSTVLAFHSCSRSLFPFEFHKSCLASHPRELLFFLNLPDSA